MSPSGTHLDGASHDDSGPPPPDDSTTRGSTIRGLQARSPDGMRAQRRFYGATTVALCLVVGLAATDGLQLTSAYGVRSAERTVAGGGYRLTVHYATVSRPALATPLRIDVTHDGGFSGPVVLGVDRSYLAMWDENGLSPAPSGEIVNGPWVEWEFDPPVGELLSVTFDARIEPAAQTGRDGAVRLLVDDEVVAEVDFRTRVMP